MELIHDFNLQGIFVLSQGTILLKLTRNFFLSVSLPWSLFPFAFVVRRGFRTHAIFKMELFATVAKIYNLPSLVAKCSILYFAMVPGAASWKVIPQYDMFCEKRFRNKVFSFQQNIL